MKINRYKLKDDVTAADLVAYGISPGGNFVQEDAVFSRCFPLVDEIELWVAFPEDLSKWNDFDYCLVLDDDFGQPYTPFYDFWNSNIGDPFGFLGKVIAQYNEIMSRLPFLEEQEETHIERT